LIDKLNDYQRSKGALKLLRKWEEDSILGGKDSSIFWDEFCEVISQLLWLPTKTDWQDSDSTLSTEFATQLIRDKKRWFACIPVIEEARTKELDKVIALDPGVRTFLTGYDGDSFQEFGKADIGRIQRLCSHLDKLMGRASKAGRRQKRRMLEAASKLRIRIRDLVDECHKQVVNYLTSQYKVILLPTFETSQMVVKSKRKLRTKTARQMLTWGDYRFECHLKQSAKKRGVIVIDVNESYTSKTCTKCGYNHSKLGGSKTFKCPNCGHEHDRDWGGARNIMIRALRDGYECSLYQ
jgi:putative transposase